MMQSLLTVREAQMELFGNATITDYKKTLRLIHSKQIPALKDGGGYLIPRGQLNRLLGKQT